MSLARLVLFLGFLGMMDHPTLSSSKSRSENAQANGMREVEGPLTRGFLGNGKMAGSLEAWEKRCWQRVETPIARGRRFES